MPHDAAGGDMAAFKDADHFWWQQCGNCGMAWFIGDKPADEEAGETCASCLSESAEVASLKEALRPFALFAERFDATPLRGISDALYTIHGGLPDKEAELRLSGCRKAREALK